MSLDLYIKTFYIYPNNKNLQIYVMFTKPNKKYNKQNQTKLKQQQQKNNYKK